MYYLAWNGFIVSSFFKEYGDAEEYKKSKTVDGHIAIRTDLKPDAIETVVGDPCLFIPPDQIDIVCPSRDTATDFMRSVMGDLPT